MKSQIDLALQYLDEPVISKSQWSESPMQATQSTQRDSTSYTPPASQLYSQPSQPYTQQASQQVRCALPCSICSLMPKNGVWKWTTAITKVL
ncbi:hypothetical protein I7I48_08332 [Histoplasma ohiense]|nr:hypothetical protein I7I48_08332 [Histoplasma ohiense (nom. inval.)]